MATAEKRTLSIEARLKDHLTAPLGVIERTLKGFAAGGLAGLKRLVSGFFSLKSAVVGLVAAYGGLRAIGAIREFGEQADALLKLAGTTGDTIANLSELQAAFELAGVKADQFDDVLRTLQNAQRDAADGSEKQRDAFAELARGHVTDAQRVYPLTADDERDRIEGQGPAPGGQPPVPPVPPHSEDGSTDDPPAA
jgi:hypothetical protein